uniref:Fucosyltransferase n=1 Tax=Meloidogyne hapla TaxID=6305 RepID=A0A1I8BC46_MELHA
MRNIWRKLQNYKLFNGQNNNNRLNHKLRYFYFILFCISLILLFPFYAKFAEIKGLGLKEKSQKIPPNPKLKPIILGWNTIYYYDNVISMLTGMFNINECPYECEYSTDRNKYLNASAIVYYIRTEHNGLPKIRPPNQLYVFCLDEPPHYTFEFFKKVPPDFFNISMTYRLDSDIYYPYDQFVPCNGECQVDEYWTEKEVMENVIRKTDLAMQVNSDCDTPSKRENLVDELRKLIKIDLYGKCVRGANCDFEYCYNRELENHMFYLAFENAVCKSYVTEKFWNLKHLIVPVVLTRRVLDKWKVPDSAYIAVDDFNNIKELADYLLYLQKNRTEYLKYFDWTKTYRKTNYHVLHKKLTRKYYQAFILPQNGTHAPTYNPLCNLCELLHQQHGKGHPKLIIPDIWKFWNGPDVCIDNWVDFYLKGKHKEAFEKANWTERN